MRFYVKFLWEYFKKFVYVCECLLQTWNMVLWNQFGYIYILYICRTPKVSVGYTLSHSNNVYVTFSFFYIMFYYKFPCNCKLQQLIISTFQFSYLAKCVQFTYCNVEISPSVHNKGLQGLNFSVCKIWYSKCAIYREKCIVVNMIPCFLSIVAC